MFFSVEPIIFMFIFCTGAQMFLTQDFYFERICTEAFPRQKDVCFGKELLNISRSGMGNMEQVQSKVVIIWMVWSSLFVSISIIMAQVFGFYMDRYSRKNVMMVPLMGQTLTFIGFVLITHIKSSSIYLTLILPFIAGGTGGYVVLKAACMSYLVQIIPSAEERTSRFSLVVGSFFFGGSTGLFSVKLLLNYVSEDYSFLFLVVTAVSILNILYTWFLLPNLKGIAKVDENNGDESQKKEDSVELKKKDALETTALKSTKSSDDKSLYQNIEDSSIKAAPPYSRSASSEEPNVIIKSNSSTRSVIKEVTSGVYSKLTDALKTTFRKRPNGIRNLIIINLIANGLCEMMKQVEVDLSYIYLKARMNLSFGGFLQYFGIKTCTDGLSLLLGVPLLRLLRISDAVVGVMGGLSRVAFFIFFAFVSSPSALYWGILINIFGFYALVVSKGLMSKMVLDSEQGRVLTVLASWEQLTSVIGALLFDSIFSALQDNHLAYVTMLISAGLGLVVTIIYGYLYFVLDPRKEGLTSDDETTSLLQASLSQ